MFFNIQDNKFKEVQGQAELVFPKESFGQHLIDQVKDPETSSRRQSVYLRINE